MMLFLFLPLGGSTVQSVTFTLAFIQTRKRNVGFHSILVLMGSSLDRQKCLSFIDQKHVNGQLSMET